MPNDLSPCPDLTSVHDPLLDRAARFVQRAEALAVSPALSQTDAVTALDHLAQMQRTLANRRRDAESASGPIRRAEDAIRSARTAMTEALMQAHPSDMAMGLVPHGPARSNELALQPASICRELLDLEALRPFLSTAALQDAIVRRSRATGAADVAGVAYAALPDSAHLDCTTF